MVLGVLIGIAASLLLVTIIIILIFKIRSRDDEGGIKMMMKKRKKEKTRTDKMNGKSMKLLQCDDESGDAQEAKNPDVIPPSGNSLGNFLLLFFSPSTIKPNVQTTIRTQLVLSFLTFQQQNIPRAYTSYRQILKLSAAALTSKRTFTRSHLRMV